MTPRKISKSKRNIKNNIDAKITHAIYVKICQKQHLFTVLSTPAVRRFASAFRSREANNSEVCDDNIWSKDTAKANRFTPFLIIFTQRLKRQSMPHERTYMSHGYVGALGDTYIESLKYLQTTRA